MASLLLLSMLSAPTHAQGEHARRVAAELQVLLGDIRRLKTESLSDNHKDGLIQRIRGGLAGLDIQLRLAQQELGRPPRTDTTLINSLNHHLIDDIDRLATELSTLAREFPLTLSYTGANWSDKQLTELEALHSNHCAACHDNANTETQRPAFNLYEVSKSLSTTEITARMILGVRGDRVTGIDNPLSDYELAGLIHLYRNR